MERTVLLTGTSSGLGEAAARGFLAEGWNVMATARKAGAAVAGTDHPRLARASLDVTNEASIEAAFDEAEARFGAVDVVVNNAAAGLGGAIEEIGLDQFRGLFDVNVIGVIAVCRAAIRRMRPRRSGLLINVTSLAGQVGIPFLAPYCASKFAVEGLTESLFYELEPFGIAVKLVEPGSVRSNFSHPWAMAPAYDPASAKVLEVMETGLANAVPAEDVARTVLAAANDDSPRLRYPTENVEAMLRLNHTLSEADWRATMASGFGLAAS